MIEEYCIGGLCIITICIENPVMVLSTVIIFNDNAFNFENGFGSSILELEVLKIVFKAKSSIHCS